MFCTKKKNIGAVCVCFFFVCSVLQAITPCHSLLADLETVVRLSL